MEETKFWLHMLSDAFKFPTSQLVQFRALVTPCMPRCDPVRCSDTHTQSFGRRRREVAEEVIDDHPEAVNNVAQNSQTQSGSSNGSKKPEQVAKSEATVKCSTLLAI